MSTVINRTTLVIIDSVNTPDYPVEYWIINPDLSALTGVPKKYWKVVGDTVIEMDQSEKDDVDAALLPTAKIAKKISLQNDADTMIISLGYSNEIQLSFQSMYSDSNRIRPNRLGYLQSYIEWINQINNEIKTKQDSVDIQTTLDVRVVGGAITFDNSTNNIIVSEDWTTELSTRPICHLSNSDGSLPSELAAYPAETDFYVIYVDATHIQVSESNSGSAIAFTDDGTGESIITRESDGDFIGVSGVTLDTTTLIAANPDKTIAGAMTVADELDLFNFINANADVEDPPTGVHGPFYLMQELMHRRELYGDNENPLYYPEQNQAILGESGILVSHAGRISNVEDIHDKGAWHDQDVRKANWKRPSDLLIFYGWLNSFNSGKNAWYNEKVAQDIAHYGMAVYGDGIQDPGHGDYANTQIIVPRVRELNCCFKAFGYVSANQTLVNFKTKVDQWDTLQVQGIFIDEAGYDYGKTRAEFNEMLDYVHGKTYANIAFANAWNTDNILGTANDVSFPNSTYNDPLTESNLSEDDWILLESFPINTTAYSGNAGYESKSDWATRGSKAIALRATYNVNFAGCGIINDDNNSGQDLFNFGFISSIMWSLEAWGTSDTSYGSGSATTRFWQRPEVSYLNGLWTLNADIRVDDLDSDVYHRYTEDAKLSLDFSTSAQLSYIGYSDRRRVVGVSSVATTATGSSYQSLKSIIIPSNTLVKNIVLRIQAGVRRTTGSGNGTYRLTFGGTEIVTLSASGNTPIILNGNIYLNGSSVDGYLGHDADRAYGAGGTIACNIDQSLALLVDLATDGDVFTCDWWTVEIISSNS